MLVSKQKSAWVGASTDELTETLPTLSEGYKQDPVTVVRKKLAP